MPAGERTQSSFALFLIFAGANIVATTCRSEPRSLGPSCAVLAARIVVPVP
jgi:hypothetical protein